jgi:acyl-CoA reductase-like NAD-dependent aldehyde dehydrogenase
VTAITGHAAVHAFLDRPLAGEWPYLWRIYARSRPWRAHCAELIDTGMVFVNEHVGSDPRLPFGGIKESDYGRELSHYRVKKFVNTNTVYVA